MKITQIEDALIDIRLGRLVIIVDDEDRENEGDLFVPAEVAEHQSINFMITHGKGLVCVPLNKEIAKRLDLPLMVEDRDNCELTRCQFTVSVDASVLQDAGISVRDRLRAISVLADESSKPTDLVRPGHMFPLIAHDKLLDGRQGHTEAATVLSQLAGFAPVGVICEVIAEDGSMARGEVLEAFAEKHGLKIVSIADLVAYMESKRNDA